MTAGPLFSVGHGSRTSEELLALLAAEGIECVVDVRAYPVSRRHPQFSRVPLEAALAASGMRYRWEGDALGGMRRPAGNSPHVALADAAFRGYAEHMASRPFREGIERLIALAAEQRVAFLCAERQPVHCHRAFIADGLVARGVEVLHLVVPGDVRRHSLHPSARVTAEGVVYDSGLQLALGF